SPLLARPRDRMGGRPRHAKPRQPSGNGRPPGTTSWKRSITEAGTTMESYYGRPIIKEPVWTWEIPTYFFTGGLAGGLSVLSSAARLSGNEKLARTALYLGAAADLVSPALLVSDLGRPERFHHMFRVLKVTSPMNIGSWVLLVNGGATTTAALLEWLGRLKPVKILAEVVSTLAGPPLATYTGVLIADTAVPVWHEGRHELPWIFGASAAASAGAAASMFVDPRDAGPARRVAVAGVLAEGALMQLMERRLGTVGEVCHQGEAGKFSWAAKGLSTAGAALLARRGRKSRASAVLGGAMVCAGELCLRWAVFKAGFQSARDPKYVVESQRQRIEHEGTKATTKPDDRPGPADRGA
ncbi:MAG TPA: NrfD/PsrC family molybdoenzyme membrane anchor subunit, partial [Gaiellaceae bacterium]|nr:NrfD/PsrC family molybdoenzyme membrane anchor subunit [Gaiellaceae bacterium]